MKLVILITAKIEHGLKIAQGWHDVGAPGVTIMRGYGLHTLRREVRSGTVELPRMIASMAGAMVAIMDNLQENGEILLSVVSADMVDRLIEKSTEILGDLTKPDNGILFVIDVERAVGVTHHGNPPDEKPHD